MGRRAPTPRAGPCRALLAAALLGCLVSCTSAPEPSTPSSPPATVRATGDPAAPGAVGFSPGYRVLELDDDLLARQLDLDVSAGARWWRIDLDWSRIERVPGSPDWSAPDRVVAAARARGLEVLALPGYAPSWAVDARGAPDPVAYAAFVSRAVRRYVPLGVRTWELWNEPNLRSAWGAPPDPQAYGRLLRAAAAAVVAADPGATVLSGGLAPVPDRTGSAMSMAEFLAAVAQPGPVPGLGGVAVHPYVYPLLPREAPAAATNGFSLLPVLHGLSRRLGAPDGAVWATEVGAPTGTDPRAVTPQEQAATLEQAHALLSARPWTGPMLVYSDRDLSGDPADREARFGLLEEDYRPKPAWQTFTRLADGGAGAAPLRGRG